MSTLPTDWVWVEPGAFVMGRPRHPNYENDADIQNTVTLTRGFWVQDHPVTQAEWKARMKNNPSKFARAPEGPQHPVEQVSWFEAIAYCNAMSKKHKLRPCYSLTHLSGKPGSKRSPYLIMDVKWDPDADGFRLLTEAEWERVCRAGTTTITYAEGASATEYTDTDERLATIAWFAHNARGSTHPVKGLPANALGVHDMLGNVGEWVWDWHARDTYTTDRTDPTGPEAGEYRVYRGGSWGDYASSVTACDRNDTTPMTLSSAIGFRCARSGLAPS